MPKVRSVMSYEFCSKFHMLSCRLVLGLSKNTERKINPKTEVAQSVFLMTVCGLDGGWSWLWVVLMMGVLDDCVWSWWLVFLTMGGLNDGCSWWLYVVLMVDGLDSGCSWWLCVVLMVGGLDSGWSRWWVFLMTVCGLDGWCSWQWVVLMMGVIHDCVWSSWLCVVLTVGGLDDGCSWWLCVVLMVGVLDSGWSRWWAFLMTVCGLDGWCSWQCVVLMMCVLDDCVWSWWLVFLTMRGLDGVCSWRWVVSMIGVLDDSVWSWWCVFLVCRSCMMNTILSKMVSGLNSTATLSHSTQPTDLPLGSQAAAQQSPLESCFCSIHRNGCVDSDAVHRLDTLLTATGPVCYTDQLVHVCWWWCFLWQFSISMLLCCTAVCRPLMYSNVNSCYRWTVLGLDVWVFWA